MGSIHHFICWCIRLVKILQQLFHLFCRWMSCSWSFSKYFWTIGHVFQQKMVVSRVPETRRGYCRGLTPGVDDQNITDLSGKQVAHVAVVAACCCCCCCCYRCCYHSWYIYGVEGSIRTNHEPSGHITHITWNWNQKHRLPKNGTAPLLKLTASKHLSEARMLVLGSV